MMLIYLPNIFNFLPCLSIPVGPLMTMWTLVCDSKQGWSEEDAALCWLRCGTVPRLTLHCNWMPSILKRFWVAHMGDWSSRALGCVKGSVKTDTSTVAREQQDNSMCPVRPMDFVFHRMGCKPHNVHFGD